MTPEQYQQHVLGLLATTFPDEEFEGSPYPLTSAVFVVTEAEVKPETNVS